MDYSLWLRATFGKNATGIKNEPTILTKPSSILHMYNMEWHSHAKGYTTVFPDDIHSVVCNDGNCNTVEPLQCKFRIGWYSTKVLILGVVGGKFH